MRAPHCRRESGTLTTVLVVICLVVAPATAQQPAGPLSPMQQAIAEAESYLGVDEMELAESRYRSALLEGWLLLGSLDMAENDLDAAASRFRNAMGVAFETRRAESSLSLVYLQRGEVEAALRLLRDMLARDPSDIASRRLLAQALAVSGQPEMARQELREALLAAPDDLESAFALAMAQLRAGEIDEAAELLGRIADARPIARTRVLIGRTYRDFRLYEQARAELREALRMDPGISRAHFYLGTIDLLDDGRSRLDDAIAEFRSELQIDASDPITNLYLGMALIEQREPAAALSHLQAAVDLPATRADALRFLGRAQLGLDRPGEAVESLRQALVAIQEAGGDERSLSSAHYQLGLALRRTGAAAEAAEQLAMAEQLGATMTESSRRELQGYIDDSLAVQMRTDVFVPPGISALAALAAEARAQIRDVAASEMARAYFNLGVMASQSGRHAEAALSFQDAYRLAPEAPGLEYALGVAHFNAGEFSAATLPLQSALDDDPADLNLRRMTALAWLETGEYARVVELLAADSQREANPSLQYVYGLALVRSERSEEAARIFASLLATNEDWPELHVLLGQAAAQQGDYDVAIDSFDRALGLDPGVAEARDALGYIYLTTGRLDEAEFQLREELGFRPGNSGARYVLATVLDLNRKPQDALEQLRVLLTANPRFADARYLLGKILLAEGRPEEAVSNLEAAVSLAPEDPNIHYQLGQAYQRLGRRDEAQSAFARFRELKQQQRQETR